MTQPKQTAPRIVPHSLQVKEPSEPGKVTDKQKRPDMSSVKVQTQGKLTSESEQQRTDITCQMQGS